MMDENGDRQGVWMGILRTKDGNLLFSHRNGKGQLIPVSSLARMPKVLSLSYALMMEMVPKQLGRSKGDPNF